VKKEINIYYLLYAISCIFIFLRLEINYGSDLKAPFTDDFYYYLTTARNLLSYKLISFDQISITNGFQPLWFLIIVILKFLIQNEILFNSSIIILIFILSLFTFRNLKFFLEKQNYSEASSTFISVSVSFLSLFFSKNGMEISLAIFLFSKSLIYLNQNKIIFCFFAFLTFLSRLEFILFYFIILFHESFFEKKIFKIKYVLKISILPILIIIYMTINYFFFKNLFPESGLAKSLSIETKFNHETFSFLSSAGLGKRFISLLFYINIFGLFFIFSKFLSKFTKFALITCLIYFVSTSLRSAWPLWTWHFFFLSISTPMVLDDFTKFFKFNLIKYRTTFVCIFFALTYFILFIKNYGINNDHILNIAKKISDHYKSSEYEMFAMGDMAGKTSYLLNKKLIQLEGLVGGKKILYSIKNQHSLCKIFNDLDIEIYLASRVKRVNNKFLVQEPSQSSKNVKKMRAFILNEPDIIFKSGDIKIFAFNMKNKQNCENYSKN